jgi:DNA-binding response OmpR family regulator
MLLLRAFRGAGFPVHLLPGAGALLVRLRLERPHLLVLDETVLEAAAERLVCLPQAPPVIALLAEEAEAPRGMGALCLRRPIRPAEVVRAARHLLDAPAGPPAATADVALVGFVGHAETLAAGLEADGYRTACLGPAAAAQGVRRAAFRLVVVDLEGEETDGLLHTLRAAAPVPVVTVGRIDWRRARWLRLLACTAFLERPVEIPRLVAAVRQLLGASARGRA